MLSISVLDVVNYYETIKDAGTTRLLESEKSATETTYKISRKQWDRDTGRELEERVIAIDRKELLAKREELVVQIALIDAFLKDADPDALQETTKG